MRGTYSSSPRSWPSLVENAASALRHNVLRWMGWHWQAPGLFAREGRPHLGLLDGSESWWLPEVRQRRRDMRGIESTAGVVKLATTHRKATSVSFPVVACGRKNGSLTVTEPTHRCATFVVKNRKTKTTCFGGARSGRLFVVKNKHQAVKIDPHVHRAPRGVASSFKTPRQLPGPTLKQVRNHCSSFATLCQKTR